MDTARQPSDDADLQLASPDGPSREELERQNPLPRSYPEPDLPTPKGPQFSVADMMILTAGVATGLAGGTWMPRDLFAAVLGLVTLVGLVIVSWQPPQTRRGRLIWSTLVLAYVIAVLAAVFRP